MAISFFDDRPPVIISYRHRFTFLHCPKTAGSSINIALAPHLGPFDIMLGSEKERQALQVRPNLRTRLDAIRLHRPATLLTAAGIGRDRGKSIFALQAKAYKRRFGPVVDHPRADQVRDFDRHAFDAHFKFTFVRNPFARMVSLYLFLTRKPDEDRPPFAQFLGDLVEGRGALGRWRHLVDPWPIYAIGDRVVVDFIGRYETLDADFQRLCRHIGLPDAPLGHTKVASRYDFRDFYDPGTRGLVQRLCEREVEHFGYCFDG